MQEMDPMLDLLRTRLAKLSFSVAHPACWRALGQGVAPSIEHYSVLRTLRPDLVLDVGANRGQFTLLARQIFPGVRIRAYEPLVEEADIFRRVHGKEALVELHAFALGEIECMAEMHISGSRDSSSLLPIGELQVRLSRNTEEVGSRRIEVARLDGLVSHWELAKRALLKIDVQGYELTVLKGATEALKHCGFVYVECSEVPLYTGQALRAEVEEFMTCHGFIVRGCFNACHLDGRQVQADYLFARDSSS